MEQSNKELQSIAWSEVSEKPNKEGDFELSNNAIEEAVMADKIALLRIIDGMILSIYKRGQGKRIVKKHGQQVTQTIKYIYIKKSTDFSYRPGIFLHQPGWVQREGTHLEQCFTLLRQQLKELSDLRRRILVRMFLLDKKFFDNSRLSEPNRPDLGKPKEYDTMMAGIPEGDDEMENKQQ